MDEIGDEPLTEKPMARLIAEHCSEKRQLSPELNDWMKLLLLDYLGVTLAGIDRESARAARAAVPVSEERNPVTKSLIHGTRLWASPEDAALVNGITAHGLELDDTFEEASLHPAVVIFPALLAVADEEASPSHAVLHAAVTGYDVMCGVGVLLGAHESYSRGFHPTGVVGAIGAAAAVGTLLNLSQDQMVHSVGLAANMASGSLEFLSNGAWTKRLNAGQAAAVGIRAAKLARSGFRGPEKSIEGRDGFLVQYGCGVPADRSLNLDFGAGAMATSIKFYPCCRYMHGNIDLLREIHAAIPSLGLEDIESIHVGVIKAGASLVSEPKDRKLVVTSVVDAQFNMPFGAALALRSGQATVHDFDNAPAVAEELREWMAKVHCYTSDALEAAFPARWQAEVRLQLKDGQIIERSENAFKGSPGDRPTWEQVEEKICGLIPTEQARNLSEAVAAMNPADGIASISSNILQHQGM
jgi:2-methylcitrate dehydratase PrpD